MAGGEPIKLFFKFSYRIGNSNTYSNLEYAHSSRYKSPKLNVTSKLKIKTKQVN